MINSNSLNFRFYKIIQSQDLLERGKYQAFDTPYDAPEFDWGRAFFIITDEDYISRKLEEEDLLRRIDHIAIDGPIQIIYCPPVKKDLESISGTSSNTGFSTTLILAFTSLVCGSGT